MANPFIRTPDRLPPAVRPALLFAALCALLLAGCRATPERVPLDWPDRAASIDGWNCIRQPHLERSIWFCTDPTRNTWDELGRLSGLDPLEHRWWARHVDGQPAIESRPILGKRYTLPNRVYILLGDAALYNPLTHVPYFDPATRWLMDFPESLLSPATRPIGAAIVFRPRAPIDDGYHVTMLQDAGSTDMMRIVKSPDTWGFVFFGHGNARGLSCKEAIHPRFAGIYHLRSSQHHSFGKVVLNSCSSNRPAELLVSPNGVSKGQNKFHQPPFGSHYW
ncbi:MAG TPA: hypothetical protein VM141_00775 [Planctomycetota bacterium]|nr:hypothetical protein [Planctomycetota bacterium]